MIEATGAQIIVKMLERQGITTVTGIPGGSILPLYDELSKSNLRHILVRHEQGGGFLAQGMARSTGQPAVCLATSGPGAMNLLTALADARSDSVPLVAITGQVNTSLIGTDAFQEADTFGLSFPITKHSVMVASAEELLTAIPRAFVTAAEGRPGPVLIDVPRDIQLQKARFEAWPEPGIPERKAVRFRTGVDDFARLLEECAKILAGSSRPVLFAGGGANSTEAASAIGKLLDVFPMPVVTTLMGIGAVSSRYPGHLGMVGMHGSVAANRAMYESDVVLTLGARFDDRATGIVQKFCPDARILHVDIDAAEINKILGAHRAIVADIESAVPVLAQILRDLAPGDSATRNAWMDRLTGIKRETSSAPAAPENGAYPDPTAFIAAIPEAARTAGVNPDDIIVTTDVGQHQMWAAQYYPITKPRTFLTSGSLGTMGFGLPVAIGAAVANPGKRVVCISGDGSILMNIQELATLCELDLDVTVIVLENGSLGMVRQQQDLLCEKRLFSVDFIRSPNLPAIAEGFGIRSVDASADGWEQTAFSGKGPRFVRCAIKPEEMVMPFVPAGKSNVEAMTGVPVQR
ncbi:MAG: Acetolactate synthase isozyme 1 large subunit [Spirochaetes bacterium ADurb.Bin215]|nr:MAG: Acetolactate synthase isozyme 1 large subunit [Spirochaetes bacterium ADurb.Bin215]